MALSNLPNFPTFDVDTDKSNCGTRWEKWVSRLENLFVGLNITEEAQKRALLLHYAGEKVLDIYEAEKGDDDGTTYMEQRMSWTHISRRKRIYKWRSIHSGAINSRNINLWMNL